jgi:ribose transport system permease protein
MTDRAPGTDGAVKPRSGAVRALRNLVGMREFAILVAVILLSLVLNTLNGNFSNPNNLNAILIGLSIDGIMVVGMTMILVQGGFDLSIGSIVGLTGIIAAMVLGSGGSWSSIGLAIVAAILVGGIMGAINGVLITRVGVNALIATLGTMGAIRGITLVITQGRPIASIPKSFDFIGQGFIFGNEGFSGLPVVVLIMLVVIVVGDILLRRTRFFRQVYYIGGSERAARLSGINVENVRLITYVVMGLLAGIAGIITTSRFSSATPLAGSGSEFRVIPAVVIGGASLAGGEGSVLGGLLGLVFVALINNGLVLLGVNVYWQQVVSGAVLITAVAADVYMQRRRAR